MDYELIDRMKTEEWINNIKERLNGTIFNILKKKYSFLDSIADINVDNDFMLKLPIYVTFFVSEEPEPKVHKKLINDVNSILHMLLMDKLDDKKAHIDVSLVLNH